jgi:transcriptional regulator with GAF, ATPase, and Fis domain
VGDLHDASQVKLLWVLQEGKSHRVGGAARALGMERTNLHKRIRALGLSRGK